MKKIIKYVDLDTCIKEHIRIREFKIKQCRIATVRKELNDQIQKLKQMLV